jgi:hypothetical protein
MVKHQRRSHQRGIHSSELDDGETSDSDSGDSPTTPEHYGQIQWLQSMKSSTPHPIPQHVHTLQRAHSFNDFDQPHVNGYAMSQSYSNRHSTPGDSHSYPDSPLIHDQHVVRGSSHQHSYYVAEQGNPGVATMNTASNLPTPQYQLAAQHHTQRSLSYPAQSVPSVTSSPGTYSSASCRSPMPQDLYYSHHPVPPTSAYPVHSASPIDRQPMIRYANTPSLSHVPTHTLPSSVPMISHVQEQYQQVQAEQQWYANSPCHGPVQVSQAQCESLCTPWVKIENFGDIHHALPGVSIEGL